MATRTISEIQARELRRKLEESEARGLATTERVRRLELEVAALRQLIETQTGFLSELWASPRAHAAGGK